MAKIYKQTKNIQRNITHRGILNSPHLCKQLWTPPLTSMPYNQEPLRCKTEMKLGLISMESGKNPSVIKSSSKETACWGCKQESKHHYSAHLFSLPEPMENKLCANSCPPIKGELPISKLYNPNWLDSPSHIIWVCG